MAKKNNLPPEDDENNIDGSDENSGEGDDEENEGGIGDDFLDDLNNMDFDEEEIANEQKNRRNKINNHPLYKQAWEIFHLTEALVASMAPLNKGEDFDESIGRSFMESACILAPKIAGAINMKDFTGAMQNAAIIRYHAEHLRLATNTLHHFTKVDRKHCKLHRAEMEKFRKLFCEWMNDVKGYEKFGEDEWNVF